MESRLLARSTALRQSAVLRLIGAGGVWNVYFCAFKLGRLDERHMRIEDEYGRLKRNNV